MSTLLTSLLLYKRVRLNYEARISRVCLTVTGVTSKCNKRPFAFKQHFFLYLLLQPELHLPQRWRSSHLRSQWGADHRATSPTPAPDAATSASATPAQPHFPGLLRLSPRHGGGELGGGGKDGWTRPCDSPAPRHGMLPELPSPLPGEVRYTCGNAAYYQVGLLFTVIIYLSN